MDKHPLLTSTEAAFEAMRCLYCYDAPCIKSCPTAIDIPTFIRKIATDNLVGAARTILSANLLGASCARVCPVEVLCESTCVYLEQDRRAIPIGRLQRYAVEHGASADIFPKQSGGGGSVGLVGAGPASLACAGTLCLLGHEAVIYEKRRLPGGLNTTGVAPYKIDLGGALAEVAFIESLGVRIETGVEIGDGVTADDLLSRHDAVFLGMGLGADSKLGVPGEDGAGVFGAIDWIERMKTEEGCSLDGIRRAVVVGGGNTALDVVREFKGLGVEDVKLLYRRGRDQMSGYRHELEAALEAGVVLLENAVVTEVIRDQGCVVGLRAAVAQDGRATSQSMNDLPVDMLVVAIGQAKLRGLVSAFEGVALDEAGRIIADPQSFVTGHPQVFTGGDAYNGGKEVVNAAHDGQAAARAIDRLIRGSSEGCDGA